VSKLSQEERDALLSDLSQMGSSGRAEGESRATFRRTFLPVAEHARAFDPDVALVVGERGSGKSELFRAVVEENLLDSIVAGPYAPKIRSRNTTWLAGHPRPREFPDAPGLKRFLSSQTNKREAASQFWFAYLVRLLKGHLPVGSGIDETGFLDLPGANVDQILSEFQHAGNKPLITLDRLDAELEASDRWIFVSYDELDTLGDYDWDVLFQAIQGLVSFWAGYSRRWTRLRAKIFLRTDLFRRHSLSLGADLSKLAANRAEISWNDRNLYAMLIKRIANSSPGLKEYCALSRIDLAEDQSLGWIPNLRSAEDARPFVERLAGQYMGKGVKKGSTFRWLLNHVRDGNERAMPRALVRLIERAAQLERDVPRAVHSHLVAPASLRRALDSVSHEHVTEVNTHELPWLPGVRERLKGEGAPMPRKDAERRLSQDFDRGWSSVAPAVRPPVNNPSELVDYLTEIGVFRFRADRRVDVPDLFLAGLGMTRKGGVARR
jgi:hypothetical protein